MAHFTEEELQEIMVRFDTTREDAMTAPHGILEHMRLPIPEPTDKEIEYGREVAKRIARDVGL